MIKKEEAKLTELDKDLNEGKPSKIDVLKIGKNRTEKDVINTVKVKKEDTFKEVQDNNAESVSKIVFDVPVDKILDPKKNLTYAKKILDGIPEPSEAGNIQEYYAYEPAASS